MRLLDNIWGTYVNRIGAFGYPYRKYFPLSLGVALGLLIFFAPHAEWHGDLIAFRTTSESLRHPYWARWIFYLLSLPPEIVAFIGLSLVSIGFFYFAVLVFEGKHWMVFSSFAFAWTLFYGQIDGLVIGGLAIAWLALKHKRPYLIGLGIIIASIKPQISLPLILALWWWSPSRIKALVIPFIVVGASFAIWGWWIPQWLINIRLTDDLVDLTRNVSLWPILGPWVLIILPIIFWLPLVRSRKLIAISAGTALTAPYFPFPSTVLFLCMPIPWWIWGLIQLPLLTPLLGYWIYYAMKVVVIAILVWSAWPVIRKYIISKESDSRTLPQT